MAPCDWANGGSVNVFYGGYGFTYGELMLFYGMGVELKDKIMLSCFREVKCTQGFATRMLY